MTEPSADFDAFLARLPDEQRAALEQLRQVIRAAAPEAVEAVAYGVPRSSTGPAIGLDRRSKSHCAFYVQSPAVMDAHATELAGYDTAKGTVRFSRSEPLPAALVTKLVRARIAETDAASKR